MRAYLGLMLASVLALAACTDRTTRDDPDPDPRPPFSGVVAAANPLVSFDRCEDLRSYAVKHALEMVGPWGLIGNVAYTEGMAESAAGGSSAAGAPVQGEDYSGTNVQEAGVDEPDQVKTDGEYLYLINEDYLEVVDVRRTEPRLISSVRLDGWGSELLLDGSRLLVTTQSEGGARPVDQDSPYWSGGTALSLYDIGDPASPRLVATLQLDGWVLSSRLVDGVARVVLRAEPVGLPFVMPKGSGLFAERRATERNRQVIKESTAQNWLPYFVHTAADGTETEGVLLDCDQVHRPSDFSGLGTTSVLSLDLAGTLEPGGGTAVVAGSETVYASADRLYVATNQWVDWESLDRGDRRRIDDRYSTDIHAFDITDPQGARYLGSGNVTGHVLNQWAMSSHERVLRVATTKGSPWWGWEENEPVSESFVTTFAEAGGGLKQLGQVGGLGEDERIYAVRFIEDTGYVVTFRETDPLYTIDLSDPADPTVAGELKILGYSAYLHPVGDGLLLGVGQDADKRGRTRGMQLSLFDVSDPADPTRLHQVTLPDAYSEIEWNHHAFLHWPRTGLTVVPFQAWSFDKLSRQESIDNGALAYTLDRADGFGEVGRVTHLPDELGQNPRSMEVAWRAGISRSMVIGDRLVTVSGLGVEVSELATLDELGWLRFPRHR